MRRTIQIEFNELSPVLLDRFIEAGELPNFRKLRDTSEVFVTDASAEDRLEPWVQWPTLHTGISDRDHGIQHLGESDRVAGRGIARELASAGFKVGVFGSMNLDYGPLDGFVVPDPWNQGAQAHPESIRAFTDFVGSAIQESSSNSLDKKKAVNFLRYLATHNPQRATAVAAARQLAGERRDKGVAWQRALVLDRMSYDVFRSLVRRHEVAYATFFSNTTAHLMHYFWRNFDPESFTTPPLADDHQSLADAVLTGYRNHDQVLGRFLADFPDDRLIFATALSQEPWDTSKCTYRPRDFVELVRLAGIDVSTISIEPVMAEEFFISFSDAEAQRQATETLAAARIGDRPLLKLDENGPLRVKAGCTVNEWSDDHGDVVLGNGTTAPFADLFYRIHGIRSGKHHPDGCLWIQSSAPRRVEEKVPLTSVAPTVLSLYGVEAPTYMKESAITLAEVERARDEQARRDV